MPSSKLGCCTTQQDANRPTAWLLRASPCPTRSPTAPQRQRRPFYSGPSDGSICPPAAPADVPAGYVQCSAQRYIVFEHSEARASQRTNVAFDWWVFPRLRLMVFVLTDVLIVPDQWCRSSRRTDGKPGACSIGIRERPPPQPDVTFRANPGRGHRSDQGELSEGECQRSGAGASAPAPRCSACFCEISSAIGSLLWDRAASSLRS